MNRKTILFAFLTLDFVALTAWAVLRGGDLGAIFDWLYANPWGSQIGVDLVVAISFGVAWMWRDAKKLGINPIPYIALCAVLGSLGLLAYATRRSIAAERAEPAHPGARSAVHAP